jgi:hypothetical protein
MTDKGYCAESSGNNLWQADPNFKVQFFTYVRSPFFVWFSLGTSKFDFGPKFLKEFCKENDSFDKLEWNKQLLYVSSVIIDLVFFTFVSTFISAYVIFIKLHKY